MASLLAVTKQKAVSVFRSVVTAHTGLVIPAILQRIRRVLADNEHLPDLAFFFTLLDRIAGEVMGRLIEADKANLDELAKLIEPRERRDREGEKVRGRLIDIRSITAGLFGPARSAEILATDGPTAEVSQPDLLWRQADHTTSRLENPAWVMPTRTTDSLQLDRATLASELREDMTAFRQALDDVELGRRETEKTLAVKNDLMAETTNVLRGCVSIVEGMLLLGNRPDLVDRLRRALRRRRSPSLPGGEPLPFPVEDQPTLVEVSDAESESTSTS